MEFISELSKFMSSQANDEGRIAFDAFRKHFEEETITDVQVDAMIDLCNTMGKKKILNRS